VSSRQYCHSLVEITRGGTIYAFNTGSDDPASEDVDEVGAWPNTRAYSVTNSWRTVAFTPIDPEQNSFKKTGHPKQWMGFLLEGPAGNDFQYEIVTFVEYIPSSDDHISDLTTSHSDIIGVSGIADFVGKVANSDAGQALYSRALKYVTNSVLSSTGFSALGTAAPLLQLAL